MQGPNENMLEVSDKIVAYIKKQSLWKEDLTNVSGVCQWITFVWTKIQIKQIIRVVFIVLSSILYRI